MLMVSLESGPIVTLTASELADIGGHGTQRT
jgi:hypothetical protein